MPGPQKSCHLLLIKPAKVLLFYTGADSVRGKGLVAGIQVVKPGTKTPDPDTALEINIACLQKGLLMFAPVGAGGECVKIAPPLTITEDALRESIQVLEEAVDKVLAGR
jgi:4-aminobutyrate aminotransferase-like enzyme